VIRIEGGGGREELCSWRECEEFHGNSPQKVGSGVYGVFPEGMWRLKKSAWSTGAVFFLSFLGFFLYFSIYPPPPFISALVATLDSTHIYTLFVCLCMDDHDDQILLLLSAISIPIDKNFVCLFICFSVTAGFNNVSASVLRPHKH